MSVVTSPSEDVTRVASYDRYWGSRKLSALRNYDTFDVGLSHKTYQELCGIYYGRRPMSEEL